MTINQTLNQQLANLNVLYTKLHRFHWYVKGPHFFTLHAKFEEFYEEAATIIDELAERLLIIGGEPIATLREYIDYATISESDQSLTAEEMVQELVRDYSLIVEELKIGIEVAEEANDQVTGDLFLDLVEKLHKHIWMLDSFLKA
ncbi:MAG TPA: Dps family protein [Chondromyces sp.]|nr:Dps family protein [Chondromyces sp.]